MAPRRPRDIDAELKALQERARQLRSKQKAQLGELLMATGAVEVLDPDALAGLLLHGIEQAKSKPEAVEGWRRRGETFFRHERAAADGNARARRHDDGPATVAPPGATGRLDGAGPRPAAE